MFSFLIDPELVYPRHDLNPQTAYPELAPLGAATAPENRVYDAVRSLIADTGWDRDRLGTPEWNPLGEFIRPGHKVVIKPNLVLHSVGGVPSDAIVTHASVVRVIADYALLALRRPDGTIDGQVTIADVPLQSADFEKICADAGYHVLMEHYRRQGLPVQLLDLRPHWAVIDEHFFILRREKLAGDPLGSVVFNLGTRSCHYSPDGTRNYSIQDYEDRETAQTHHGETHLYNLSRTVLDADVIINVSKVKTHNKAGVTLALKNFIGANVSKDYLPHFTRGAPQDGGDEYSHRTLYNELTRRVRAFFQSSLGERWAPLWRLLRNGARRYEKKRFQHYIPHGGGWYGNDTLWRTIVDVNHLVRFGTVDGQVADVPQRRILCFADGVVAGEGEGPLRNTAKPAGLLCAGDNSAEFDIHVATMMGFDYRKIPHLVNAIRLFGVPDGLDEALEELPDLGFQPAPGWRGHIERVRAAVGSGNR